jgi:peroxiredoxin
MQRMLPTLLLTCLCVSDAQTTGMTGQEKAIHDRMGLRKLPDGERARVTKDLALEIRELPASVNKLNLASSLANLATEGDFGRDTLQEVTTTLSGALRENPVAAQDGHIAMPYIQLARLVRYEGMQAKLDSPHFVTAMTQLEEEDGLREDIDFALTDLNGGTWKLRDLRGKVVLVNFWATWCPPCRKEMPDLQELYSRFKEKGLVILAITDEAIEKAKPFIEEKQYTFPILLDSGRKVNEAFRVDGIPKTFIYDRDGKLAAQSIDMRTREQFAGMLAKAGLK